MAVKNWYLTNTTANSWRTVDEATQTAATLSDGCVIGTTGDGATAGYRPNTETVTFSGTTQPDGSLDTAAFDGLRTTNTYNGSFANASWTFNLVGRAVSSATSQVGAVVIRLFRGANADGTGATEVTAAQQAGGNTAAMTSTTTDYTSTVTFSPGAFTVNNEYLFFQVAYKRVTAGSMSTADWNLRTGSASTTGTRIASADFLPVLTGTLSITEAADTTTASGVQSVPIGTLNITEAADTLTGTGTQLNEGDTSVTEAADTLTADGVLASSDITGTANITEAADTTTASGVQSTPVGTANVTEVADTLTASGVQSVPIGTANVTEAADTLTGAGVAVPISFGIANVTEAANTLTATGSIPVVGTTNVTEAADTLTAQGGAQAITGNASVTEAANTLTALGAGLIAGTALLNEVADTLTATGSVVVQPAITGNANITEAADTLTGQSGTLLIFTDTGIYVLLASEVELYLQEKDEAVTVFTASDEVDLNIDDEPVVVFTQPDEVGVRFPRSSS